MTNKRITVAHLKKFKQAGRKITMLTAYDYPTAALVDAAGIDVVLVGDSLANVVLGLPSTRDVGLEAMIHHAKAVRRAVKNALLIGDMPYAAYQTHPHAAVKNARRFIKEAGCDAVKLEWFPRCLEVSERIVAAGIPLMGHVGLTPQTADRLGGFKVQGQDAESAVAILRHALALEKLGCFSVVLECLPDKLGELISQKLAIPTIGIGAGKGCDGQVLVVHDLIGLSGDFRPRFVKKYFALGAVLTRALARYKNDVTLGKFPGRNNSYRMKPEEWRKVLNKVKRDTSTAH